MPFQFLKVNESGDLEPTDHTTDNPVRSDRYTLTDKGRDAIASGNPEALAEFQAAVNGGAEIKGLTDDD